MFPLIENPNLLIQFFNDTLRLTDLIMELLICLFQILILKSQILNCILILWNWVLKFLIVSLKTRLLLELIQFYLQRFNLQFQSHYCIILAFVFANYFISFFLFTFNLLFKIFYFALLIFCLLSKSIVCIFLGF